MSSLIQPAMERLANLPPEEALAVLDKLEEKRRKERFICYWEPTPEQKEELKRFTSEVKVFGLTGGNRSGKTEIGVFLCVVFCLGKKFFENEPIWEIIKDMPIPEPPVNVWMVGLDYPMMRDVIWREKLISGQRHPPFLPDDPSIVTKINNTDYQVFFANGSVLTGKSADSGREKFQSASVNLVWIDEEPDVSIYDECFQRTSDCAGKLLLTLTPLVDIGSGARTPWVYDLHEQARLGKKDVVFGKLSVLHNPFVPEEEKKRLQEKWSGHPEEGARLYGDFIQRSGLVYNQWTPTQHLVAPFPVPGNWRRIVCIDPASTGTTAALWVAVAPNGDLFGYREYYEKDLVVSEHAKNILVRSMGDPIDLWLIDPKWGAQRNAETHKSNMQLYREAGIPVRLAEVGEDFGLNASREYMQATILPNPRNPKAFFFRDLHNFRWEIEHYTWAFFQKGDMKGLSKEKPQKKNDHLMNCWQYICAFRPRAGWRQPTRMTDAARQQFARVNSYT